MRKQRGQIIRIGSRWHVRHWEGRNIGGIIERKRVRHFLGEVTTRGKRPPADIVTEAERHMATVTSGTIPADRIVTIGDFVEQIYLPWVREHKRTRLRTFSRPRRYTRRILPVSYACAKLRSSSSSRRRSSSLPRLLAFVEMTRRKLKLGT